MKWIISPASEGAQGLGPLLLPPSGSQTAQLAARLVRGRLRLRLSSPEEVAEVRVYRLGERRRVDRV